MGVQLVGRHGSEPTLLALGHSSRSVWLARSAPRRRNGSVAFRGVRAVRIHDTLSGDVVPLEPREPGRVGIYACGPTVYARIHIGNARPYVVFSLLAPSCAERATTRRWW